MVEDESSRVDVFFSLRGDIFKRGFQSWDEGRGLK